VTFLAIIQVSLVIRSLELVDRVSLTETKEGQVPIHTEGIDEHCVVFTHATVGSS